VYDGKHDGHAEKGDQPRNRRRTWKHWLLFVLEKHGSSRKVSEETARVPKEYMTKAITQGVRPRRRVLVTFDEDQVKIIQSLKGFGTITRRNSQINRNGPPKRTQLFQGSESIAID
jgi:hypothetical protein